MPRAPRFHIAGACYNVILRGNHRQDIFGQVQDRDRWEGYVSDALHDCGAALHAYCWMTNHVHMLVEIGVTPLGQVVLRMASRYARWYQKQLAITGHLFERRHRAILVRTDLHMLALARYIHRNPVRAGIVASPDDYPWCSHSQYLGRHQRNWLTTSRLLGLLSADASGARIAYAQFMLEAGDEKSPSVEGDDDHPTPVPPKRGSSRAATRFRSPALEELATEIADAHRTSLEALRSPSRSRSLSQVRALIAWRAVSSGAATISDVARLFGRSTAAVSKAVAELRGRRSHNKLNKLEPGT